MRYKVVVIGGGPGGYTAAIRAAQLGMTVALVEQDSLGGTCLNRGCIPTKVLAAGVEVLTKIRRANEFGIEVNDVRVDFSKLMARKSQVVERLTTGINFLLQKNKVQYIKGTAMLNGTDSITVKLPDGSLEQLEAENIILATGSSPVFIRQLGYDGQRVITSDEALALSSVPARMLIIGGGVIGCEFASIFAALGSKVTIVEMMPNILSTMDRDVSQQMLSLFRRQGIQVKARAKIKDICKNEEVITAQLESGEQIEADVVLLSVGRSLNCAKLGLDAAGVTTGNRGEILINDYMETSVPGIYAVGDITGKIQLAHVASAQALVAVDRIAGKTRSINYSTVPSCVFTNPEIGAVGLTAEAAKEQGYSISVAKFPMIACGKAQAMGETSGFVKVISDAETERILGVYIVGAHASDLIAEAALAVELNMTVTQLAHVIHAHPTLSESILEAAEGALGLSIHGATRM